MQKWTINSIKNHLKYLDEVNTKHPRNIKKTRLFWENELKKLEEYETNKPSTNNSDD